MVRIGNTNRLLILRDSDFGQVLDGGKRVGEVLLPTRYVDEEIEPGDELDVFLYCDSEDRVVATTEKPLAEAGEFAALEVVEVTRVGIFLNWGLPKDLLLPHSEMKGRPEVGEKVVVRVVFDKVTGRIYATQKLKLPEHAEFPTYTSNQPVEVLIASKSELGWTVVVEKEHLGMLYHNEIFEELRAGEVRTAYVREVRHDDLRIDLSLQVLGYGRVIPVLDQILAALHDGDGFVPVHDKSSPEVIEKTFGCSKKNFKKAVGALYRKGLITLEKDGLRLNEGDFTPGE